MPLTNFNEEDIRKTYRILNHINETEIRLIDPSKKINPKSIFVSTEEDFVKECINAVGKYNVYVGINERCTQGTKKEQVVSLKTIVIDIDPIRSIPNVKGIQNAATKEELECANQTADKIISDFISRRQKEPSKAMSGNGIQLWIPVPNTDLNSEDQRNQVESKVKLFISNLQKKYNTDKVTLDQIGDLPRIIKVIGTLSIKGKNTTERPHRLSQWLKYNDRDEDHIVLDEILSYTPEETLPTITTSKTNKDTRSEIEFVAIKDYLRKGLTKEEIYKKLGKAYEKWKSTPTAYRERTFKIAYAAYLGEYNKPKIRLPKEGILQSEFCEDIGNVLKTKNTIFYRRDSKDIVEVAKIQTEGESKERGNGFVVVTPNRFITLAEKYCTPIVSKCHSTKDEQGNKTEKKFYDVKKSMNSAIAIIVLTSEVFQTKLPEIKRIFTIPIPIMYNDELTFPKKGYDERFQSWLLNDAPDMTNPEMPLKEAKELIEKMLLEFCFENEQDKINAISALLTPYLRGLFPSFNTRTPVFFYLANRERAGKDYLAGITGIIFEGEALEESPISNSEKSAFSTAEELRKKILSAFIAGKKRMHFANNKGHIDNATFEGAITNPIFSDRLLGKSEILSFDNEMDFSLSGNMGVTYTSDLRNRARIINLFLGIENANLRKFSNPNLHEWVLNNRGLILSALYSLVKNWIVKKSQNGTQPFTSFPEWARICGGIMEAAGYASPCTPDKEILNTHGDLETANIKSLFELCYQKRSDQYITKRDITDIIKLDDGEIFGYFNFSEKSDQIKFGLMFDKYINRIFSDITMTVKDNTVRGSRKEYKFTKEPPKTTMWDYTK